MLNVYDFHLLLLTTSTSLIVAVVVHVSLEPQYLVAIGGSPGIVKATALTCHLKPLVWPDV